MITEHIITEGFFAGCSVYEDDELPPNTIEMHMLDGTTYRYDASKDVMTKHERRVSMFGSEDMQKLILKQLENYVPEGVK